MRDFVSKKAKELKPSGIRKFFDLCAGSKDILSLGVGEPDFVTPWAIAEEGIKTIRRGRTQYTSNKGLEELREEISIYLRDRFSVNYSKDDIIITIGASEAIDISLRAICDEGDEILIPEPSYVSYAPCVELCGGTPVSIPTRNEDEFRLTPEVLKKVLTKKTKAIIFPYPNNPTGGIMEKEDIDKIKQILIDNDILIISDEIYAELTYGKTHYSIASDKELRERTVLINGFSKAFAMTGWRVGYVCAPQDITKAMLKIHQYAIICSPIFSQYAALSGLKSGKEDNFAVVEEMREEYDRRRKFMYRTFNEMGLKSFEPKGAFYIFPSVECTGMDGNTFAETLLKEEKVAVVPGDAFGESGKNFIRCSYAYSMETLIAATDKIRAFVERHKIK